MLDILNGLFYIDCMSSLPVRQSRFTRPVFLWAMAALLAYLGVKWLGDHALLTPRSQWLTLLPLLLMICFAVAAARMMLKMDELQKRICLESFSIAFVLTLLLTLVFVGLEHAGIHRAKWDELGSDMMLLWACAYVFTVWRYR
jgi:hypothetical protein